MQHLINRFLISSVTLSFWTNVTIASAQIVPDNTLPVNSQVDTFQVTGIPVHLITGGTEIQGVNLFHSFEDFSVPTGNVAFFNNGLNIENILSRVTGDNLSNIDGLILANGTANLFLINPNGIIFGENARLNVGGSFVASTANAIGFGNQGIFSATDPEAPPLLTVNPDVLFFNQLAAQGVSSIEVRGSLSVPSGETLLLVGGNVAPSLTSTGELLIDGGSLTAPGGRVELAGVGAPGEVGLTVDKGNLRLDFPEDLARTDIAIFGSTIDVVGVDGGDIVIYARDLTIGSSIVGNQPDLGETYTLHISIENQAIDSQNPSQETEPNNSIHRAQSLDGSFSLATNPNIESSTTIPFVSISGTGDGTFDYYSFTVETAGSRGIFDIDQGDTGGAGSLDTEIFLFDAQGGLLASNDDAPTTQGADGSISIADSYISFNFDTPGTYVIGVGKYNSNSKFSQLTAGIASGLGSVDAQAGDITIDATGTVALAEGVIGNNVENGATGSGGDIRIATSSVSLTNGARIDASTWGEGNVGQVVIRATDSLLLDGEDSQGFVSGIFSRVKSGAMGNSGGVEIETGSLSLSNGALINTSTEGEGDAGQVIIRVTDSLLLDGEDSQGFGSSVFSRVESGAKGNSGGVDIESGSLTATNGGRINASTFGEGNVGQVVILTDSLLIDGEDSRGLPSGILSTVQPGAKGNSGDVDIESGSLIVTNGGRINAFTFGERDAGQVVIRVTDSLLLDGENSQGLPSSVVSQVESGAMGNSGGVDIETGSLTVTNGAKISASILGEGDAGQVVIRVTDSLLLDGENSQGLPSSVLSRVESEAKGNSGGIEIESRSLTATNGALIDASTEGEGNAGQMVIRVTDSLLLNGESRQGFLSGVVSRVESGAKGNSGGVDIESGSLTLSNGAIIDASTWGEGDAGQVVIRATDSLLLDGEFSQGFGSSIFSTVQPGAKGNSGGVDIDTGTLTLNNGAIIDASTWGEGDAGQIVIQVTDSFLLDGEDSQGLPSGVLSTVFSGAKGNSGGVDIETGTLTATNGARIITSTFGGGNAGQIEIWAIDSLLLDGESSQGFLSGVLSRVEDGAKGNSGGVDIETGSLTATNGALIDASTFGEGNAGQIEIQVTDSLLLDGESRQGDISGIFSQVESGAKGNSGGVEIETGSLTATNGALIIASTLGEGNAGQIEIQATDSLLLDGESRQGLPSGVASQVLPGAKGNSGGVNIETGFLSATNGAQITASTGGEGDAGQIEIRATDSLLLDGESRQGFLSGVFSTVELGAKGNSRGVDIETGFLSATNGAQITASTGGEGDAGQIEIRVMDSLLLDGESSQVFSSGVFSTVESGAKGNSGGVDIETGSLTATNGALIDASTFGEGDAGQVVIRATDSILLDGEDSQGFGSSIFSTVQPGAKGNSGGVDIESDSVTATNGAQISAETQSTGMAGGVRISATDFIQLIEDSSIRANATATGAAGDIILNTQQLTLENNAQILASNISSRSEGITLEGLDTLSVSQNSAISASTQTGAAGNLRINSNSHPANSVQVSHDSRLSVEAIQGGTAGDLTVKTSQMSVEDGSSVTVSSSSGRAGNLTIWANSLVLDDGQLTAETGTSGVEAGANISLDGLDILLMRDDSLISAKASGDANGGNIDINTLFLLVLPPEGVNGSDIIASAERGDGGRIIITGEGIFGIEERPAIPGNRTNDIDASSQFGNPGQVITNVPLDPSRGLIQLPSTFIDPSGQINRTCAPSNRQNQFMVTGRGGLPENPTDLVSPDWVQDDFGTVIPREEDEEIKEPADEENSSISHPPKQIIEAQGWIIDAEGNVVLTANVPNGTPHGGWQNSVNCQVSAP
ncbi:MAG: filamentous hemagglutinin N-terminal domain-containing protein [Coleofasciculus sp. B1-GNL1-01]|uniref:two-partner secretion domain-containing protein n=1 Tax=Coleofasciculus sp. B1-GNL1-01 TaxID=3068484 RepID=UPI0032F3738E